MPPKTKIDLDLLKELILQKKTQNEIMEELGIKSMMTYKAAKLALFEREGRVYKVRSKAKNKAGNRSKRGHRPSVAKNGTITLSAKMLEGSPFKYKDKFNISVGRKRIILEKVED